MDAAYIARYKERSAYEEARTEPPEGFPKLPDLPLGRYTDPEFYELEHEHLWKKVWLYAAHDSELPTPGSYKLSDIAGTPVLLVRGEDGVVRAFYNACRHRGAPVVRGECGSARMLVCQYHSWGYNLCRRPRAGARRARLRRPAEGGAWPAAGALRAVGRLALRQPGPRRRCRCWTGCNRSRRCSRSWRRHRCG